MSFEFAVGDRVRTPAFGEGTIALVDGMPPYQTLTVDFDTSGRHVVSPTQVRLELIARGEEGLALDAAAERAAEARRAAARETREAPHEASRTISHAPVRRSEPPVSDDALVPMGAVRRLLREELGLADVEIGERWRGGEVILRPGREGKEKSVPLDAFFAKVTMVRDRLRVLEQKLNSNPRLDAAEKIELQGYITKCYGSLTTFNVLFADRDDWFVGEKGSE
jgi:hypothetical protein